MTDQTLTTDAGHHWQNWGGNQSFDYAESVIATTDDDVVGAVRTAATQGHGIRVTGSGHSFTPIVQTDHTLLNISQIAGVTSANPETGRASVRAGTGLANVGAPLWDAGLSLANQGDVDAQTISGAIATGTKGSGLQFGSLSSTVRGVRLVNGQGEIVTITEDEPDLLHAAQVSSGRQSMRSDLPVAPPRRAPRDPAPCPGSIASPANALRPAARVFEREFGASCDKFRVVRTYELLATSPSSQLRGHFSGRADRI